MSKWLQWRSPCDCMYCVCTWVSGSRCSSDLGGRKGGGRKLPASPGPQTGDLTGMRLTPWCCGQGLWVWMYTFCNSHHKSSWLKIWLGFFHPCAPKPIWLIRLASSDIFIRCHDWEYGSFQTQFYHQLISDSPTSSLPVSEFPEELVGANRKSCSQRGFQTRL